MKQVGMFLLSCCMATMSMAQSDKDQPFMTKSLAGQNVSSVEAETSGGNITVEAGAADQARVEVFAWAGKNRNASKADIQKMIDEFYDLSVEVNAGRVVAKARPKTKEWNRKNSLSISFRIYTTANVATQLSTSGGNIHLAGLNGAQKISTSGGNLTIDKVKGKLKGTTSGGNINVTNSDDELILTTSGANIHADNCKGVIRLVTSGGSIMLNNLSGKTEAVTSGGNVDGNLVSGELEASTSGGNVVLKSISGDLTASTSGGNVSVDVKEPGKLIRIRNSGGDISLTLPAGKGYDLDLSANKIRTNNLGNFTGKTSDDEMNGTLNGGGSKVTVDGRQGRLTLTMK
ncbi:MAG: hypothetical protein V4725_19660 [Bacteroidota bacterium]